MAEHSVISSQTRVHGALRGDQPVEVHGQLSGTIALEATLTVGPGGVVQAQAQVREAIVHGQLSGSLKASERIVLTSSARVEATLEAPLIRVDDGARVRGQILMQVDGPAPAPLPAAQTTAQTTAQAPVQATSQATRSPAFTTSAPPSSKPGAPSSAPTSFAASAPAPAPQPPASSYTSSPAAPAPRSFASDALGPKAPDAASAPAASAPAASAPAAEPARVEVDRVEVEAVVGAFTSPRRSAAAARSPRSASSVVTLSAPEPSPEDSAPQDASPQDASPQAASRSDESPQDASPQDIAGDVSHTTPTDPQAPLQDAFAEASSPDQAPQDTAPRHDDSIEWGPNSPSSATQPSTSDAQQDMIDHDMIDHDAEPSEDQDALEHLVSVSVQGLADPSEPEQPEQPEETSEPEEPEALAPQRASAANGQPLSAEVLAQYDHYTVKELREELRRRDLPVSGTKDELIERLVESKAHD